MKAKVWVAVAAAVMLWSAAVSAQITFTPPALLNSNAGPDTGDDERPQVTTDGAGTWIAVWDSYRNFGTDADILFARSTNNGQTWSTIAALNNNAASDSGDDIRPVLSTDGAGNWVCLWESTAPVGGSGTDLDILYSRSSDNGATWAAPALLNSNGTTDSRIDEMPHLATDGLGNWVAIWDSNGNIGGAGLDYDVFVSRSTNNGQTWTAAAALNTNAVSDGGDDIRSQITTDGSGVWMAVWGSTAAIAGGGTDSDIIWARSTDNGATWTAPAAVNTNAASDSGADLRPGVATDGIGNWVVVWNSNSNLNSTGTDNDVYVARSSNNGTTWTAPGTLNSNGGTDSGTDEYVRVNTDGLGNWLAVWNGPANFGGSGTDYDIWITQSTNNGATWSTMTRMNTTANTDFWYDLVPQVTPDGNGNWIGVWESNGDIDGNTTPDYDIVLTRFTLGSLGLSANSIVPATTGPTNATSVSFTVGFSDAVINFNNAADLVFNHSGTANSGVSISGGPQNYTVNVTGITGTGSFTMAVSTTSDVRTSGGTLLTSSVTSPGVAIDNTAPGVSLASAAGDPVTGAISVTATLSESSANFAAGDISTTNASVSGFTGSGANYSFTLTPLATGSFSASVNAGTFTDAAGNNNTVSNTLSRTADLSGPQITLSSIAGDPVNGAITVTAVLTQSSTNFAAADITAVNATVDGFSGAGTNYSFTLTPLANGLFSANVAAGTFTNAGSVANSASNTLSRTANLPSAPPGSEPTTAVVANPDMNSDVGDDERPMLATDGNGNWVMVWDVNLALNGNAGSDMDILVTRSSDNGATWSSPALLNTNGMADSGTDIRPMVATNGTGMWIAVWNSDENIGGSGGDNDVFYARSTNNGATWSAPALLNTNGTVDGGSDEMVRVAADANGNWVATWLSSSSFAGNGNEFDVAVSRSTDNGATWSPPAVLNSNGLVDGATETRVDVVTDGNGMWIALWASDENLDGQSAFDYDILYARSTNNGATWSTSARLNTNATSDSGGDFRPAIATDRNNNWVATWHSVDTAGSGDFDILVARSSDNGATWSAPTLLNQGGGADGGDDDNVRLATDESGNWIAVWESSANIAGTGTDWDVFMSRSTDNGATWGTPGLLNSHGTTDDRFDLVPVIGTDRSGAWVTAWETSYTFEDTAGFDFDIAVSRFSIITSLRALTVVPATTGPTNASTVNFTVTFNNDTINFNNAADVVINHTGTANTGVTISGGPREFNVAVTGVSGNGSFTLAASTTSDVRTATGNIPLSQSATSAAVMIDTTAPTISLTSDAAATVNAGITVTATLSESSTNFVAGDINTTNATVSNFGGSGTNYSFTLTPNASGAFNASVPASRFTDAAGNNNTVSNTLSRTADITPPTATLSTSAAATVNTFITINVVLSESSTNFAAGDITAVNGTVSNFTGSGTAYSFRLTPAATGTFSAQIDAGAFTDAIGNNNTASNTLSRVADLTPPTALIASTALDPVAGTINVTVTLSEASTNFTSGDVTRTNCTLGSFTGSGTSYSFTLNPSNSSGTYGAVIAAGTFTDAIGNQNIVSNTFQRTVDEVRPTMTFATAAASTVNGPITVTATASESTTNFVVGDLTLSNATASNFTGSGANYSFTLTPVANGTFSVRVTASVFTDFAGNTNTSSSTLSRTADLTPPTISLSSSAATTVNTFITITATLSQTSTNFGIDDITPVNGTVSNFSGSGTSYSFRLTPLASGAFSAQVAAGTFTDAATNGNTASNTLSRTADLTAPTITLVNTTGSPTSSFITVSVTLSESSSNFTSADITTSNATVSNFGGSGTSYSFRLNPSALGTFTGQVQAGRFTDAVGNNNTASNLISAVRN